MGKECPKCAFLKPAGIRKCQACGFEPERQSPIEEHDGDLVQLSGKRRKKGEATPHDKQTFWSMTLWHAKAKGWKEGAAAHRFKDRFGVWPRSLRDVPMAPDVEFDRYMRGQEQSRNIAWRKAQERQKAMMAEASHAA